MDKPVENSRRGLPDRKSKQDNHLSDEFLLLAVDGELSAREAAHVKDHLEACWACRARQDRIEESIADVVAYRNCLLKPYLPPPPSGRAMFVARLEQLADKIGRPSLWSRLSGVLRARMASPPRPVWISTLVMVSFVLFILTVLQEAPVASASELLRNAQFFEASALRSVEKPVVYQKLRIRSGSRIVTRTIYRDPVGNRQADHTEVSEDSPGLGRDTSAELQRAFERAQFNWNDPLSAADYSVWRSNLSRKQDEVTRIGNGLLLLKTTTPDGPIAEAQLTVRATDYHPVAQHLRLRDDSQIEIAELAYEVLRLDAVNPAIFAPDRPRKIPPSALRASAPVSPTPSETELAEAELQVRIALHSTGADLGEPIDVIRNTQQGVVVVRGLTATAERKEKLLTALEGIAHVDRQLQTVSEATAEQLLAETPEGLRAIAVVGHPALQQQLQEWFPDPEERSAFVNQALALAEDAMARVWALRRLRDRYRAEEIARLSVSSQQTLELLIRDHIASIRQQMEAVRKLIAPFLPPVSDAEPAAVAAPPSPLEDGPAVAGQPAASGLPAVAGWRSGVTRSFVSIQSVQESVAVLLAGSGSTAAEPEALLRELQHALAQLESQLPALSQQVYGPFLSGSISAERNKED